MRDLCAYGLIGAHETERLPILKHTIEKFDKYLIIDAIYPKFRKIPLQRAILQAGASRCNRQLSLGELGCLLSHRKIWKTFLHSCYSHALILESDSKIIDFDLVNRIIDDHRQSYDILFLGSYSSRTKLRRSEKKRNDGYAIGVPVQVTLFCTYGYLINKKVATHLLNVTRKTAWPVDYWNKWLTSGSGEWCLKVGAIVPDAISTWNFESTIQSAGDVQAYGRISNTIKVFLVDIRNNIMALFS